MKQSKIWSSRLFFWQRCVMQFVVFMFSFQFHFHFFSRIEQQQQMFVKFQLGLLFNQNYFQPGIIILMMMADNEDCFSFFILSKQHDFVEGEILIYPSVLLF